MSRWSDRSRTDRILRVANIGATILCALGIFAFIAYSERPHPYVLAILVTLGFVVIVTVFDVIRYRRSENRPPPPA